MPYLWSSGLPEEDLDEVVLVLVGREHHLRVMSHKSTAPHRTTPNHITSPGHGHATTVAIAKNGEEEKEREREREDAAQTVKERGEGCSW